MDNGSPINQEQPEAPLAAADDAGRVDVVNVDSVDSGPAEFEVQISEVETERVEPPSLHPSSSDSIEDKKMDILQAPASDSTLTPNRDTDQLQHSTSAGQGKGMCLILP